MIKQHRLVLRFPCVTICCAASDELLSCSRTNQGLRTSFSGRGSEPGGIRGLKIGKGKGKGKGKGTSVRYGYSL